MLDSLDKCQLPLDFDPKNDLTNTREPVSMDRLLTNLIKGTLLPSACLWILTQHSSAEKIPAEFIDRVTECQGMLTIYPSIYTVVLHDSGKNKDIQRDISTSHLTNLL